MAATPPVLPFGARGNTQGGNSTGGPTATAAPTTPANCPLPRQGFPFTNDTPNPDSQPTTVYKITDCDTGEARYTTEALTTGISAEVGRAVKVAEYPSQCWQVVIIANPGSASTEALTISSSTPTCGTCLDPALCALPAGNPPAGMATVYQSAAVSVGAGLTWEDHNGSESSVKLSESIRWEWDVTGYWKSIFDNTGPFGYTWSLASDGRWFNVSHGTGSSSFSNPFIRLNIYTKASLQAAIDSTEWELAPGHAMSEIEDGACVWGAEIGTWTEDAALGRIGFLYIKLTGTTPAGDYHWFLTGPDMKPSGAQPYYEAPQTSITLVGIS